MRYRMTEAALHRIGKLWVKIVKEKIRNKKKIASRFLIDSIKYEVITASDGEPILSVQYADYYKYVNRGRRPRGNDRPITAENGAVPIGIKKPGLLQWIQIKGLRGRDKKGKFMSNLSLAYAIRASIWKKGIKPFGKQPTLFFDPALDKLEKMLDPTNIPAGTPAELRRELEEIFVAATEDINIVIENMITTSISKI